MRRHSPFVLGGLLVLILASGPAVADPPSVSSFFPGGGRIGESVRVEAKGAFKPWPVQVHLDRPGVCFDPVEDEEGVFEVAIADDAAPGVYWVRLFNDDGAATLRPFLVGTLPEVVEAEPNNADDQAQEVDAGGVVINGRLERAGDVDAFAVSLESGQSLAVALEANNRLGSPMDGKLQIVSPEGFVVDHADDSPLLDPSLVFSAPTSGTYLVRAFAFPSEPDSSIRYAGGDDYVYRLTVTTGGYVDLVHPSVIPSDGEIEVVGVGWNLSGDPPALQLTQGPEHSAVAWHPELAGFAETTLVDLPVVRSSDAREEPAVIPALVCGQILEDGKAGDTFCLKAEPGASVLLRVEARAFGSPLDAVLKVDDSSGNQIAEMDDLRRALDPELTVKVPDDGLLTLHVRDLHRRIGSQFVYRVEAREPSPDFALTVEADRFVLDPEKALTIDVTVDRQDGFPGPITVGVEGLPEGIGFEPVVSEPEGDSSKKVTLELKGDGAEAWSGSIRVIGDFGEESASRPATTERVGGSRTESLWLTVRPSS